MTRKGIELPSKTIELVINPSRNNYPGFVKVQSAQREHGQFAKALASGFLKFSREAQDLMAQESVQSFIQLAELHQELTKEVRAYLQDELPFVYDGQPIQQFLLEFASYRLKKAHERQRFASLQGCPEAVMDELRSLVRSRQETYDSILQCQ